MQWLPPSSLSVHFPHDVQSAAAFVFPARVEWAQCARLRSPPQEWWQVTESLFDAAIAACGLVTRAGVAGCQGVSVGVVPSRTGHGTVPKDVMPQNVTKFARHLCESMALPPFSRRINMVAEDAIEGTSGTSTPIGAGQSLPAWGGIGARALQEPSC